MTMSWAAEAGTLSDLADLSPAGPAFRDYIAQVWSDPATDRALLETCRQRFETLLGVADHQITAATPREQAALEFAEQWLIDPSAMTDAQCQELRSQLGDSGAAAFTFGLSVVEATLRASLALGLRA